MVCHATQCRHQNVKTVQEGVFPSGCGEKKKKLKNNRQTVPQHGFDMLNRNSAHACQIKFR